MFLQKWMFQKNPCWSYSGNSQICLENSSASLISSSLSPFQGCFLPWSGFLASWKKVDDAPTGQVCRLLSKVVEKTLYRRPMMENTCSPIPLPSLSPLWRDCVCKCSRIKQRQNLLLKSLTQAKEGGHTYLTSKCFATS